ncbi:MAG: hypothetical protein GY853_13215 [PVC group bacterium]|nr:hypothetical protein [PVC group bacterium]
MKVIFIDKCGETCPYFGALWLKEYCLKLKRSVKVDYLDAECPLNDLKED